MKPELELEDLEDKIPEINQENAAFAEGDHWQNAAGWTGPQADPNSIIAASVLADIERIFVSKDVLKEIRLRERWALTGKAWTWVLTDAEGVALEGDEGLEYKRWLDEWMEEKQIVSVIADAIEKSSWSGDEGIPGRGLLRFFIPSHRLENGRAQADNLGAALKLLELESPDSELGVVFRDADSGYEPVGFLSWEEEIGGEDVEQSELVYVDENGMTIIESLSEGENVGQGVTEVNLNKNITIYQLERPLLIDSSLRSMQKFLNSSYTAWQAAISGAGWPEDFFMGIMPPGAYVDDDDGGLIFQSEPFTRGPGRAHFFQVRTMLDDDGNEKAVSPSVHSRTEPVSPHLFDTTVKELRNSMISQVFQEYTLLTGLAQASGEKLQLAKGDFEASATDMANETRLMVRWVLETALMLAESISGGGSEPAGIKAKVEVQIDTGVVTTEQKVALSSLVQEGFISHETALAEAGYNQPMAERNKALAEREETAESSEVQQEGENTAESSETDIEPDSEENEQ